MSKIFLNGATEHNLKNLTIEIPKNQLVGVTGKSGSGKSSLVFDTLYAESFRRFASAGHAPVMLLGRSFGSRMNRPKFSSLSGLPPALGLSQKQGIAGPLSTVGTLSGIVDLFRVLYAVYGQVYCRKCDIPLDGLSTDGILDQLESRFSGQKIFLAAPIAVKRKGAFAKELEEFRKSGYSRVKVNGVLYSLQDEMPKLVATKFNDVDLYVDSLKVEPDKRMRLRRSLENAIMYGNGVVRIEDSKWNHQCFYNTSSVCPICMENAPKLDPRHFSHASLGQCEECKGYGSMGADLPSDLFPCHACGGSRLGKNLPLVRYHGVEFGKLMSFELEERVRFFNSDMINSISKNSAEYKIVDEIKRLLNSFVRLNLGHLPLNREGNSLQPGDLQRLRLVTMIANQLKGVLFAVDEPCQGLTAAEVASLVGVLKDLTLTGASVVAVEHHPEFLKLCDHLIVMGPGAGEHGGKIVEQFDVVHKKDRLEKKPTSKSGNTASAKKSSKVTPHQGLLEIEVNKIRNLVGKNVTIHSKNVNLIRGSSGSGKSTFMDWCLRSALQEFSEAQKDLHVGSCYSAKKDALVKIDTIHEISPGTMARNSRRSVASALDITNHLRTLYANLQQSQILGLTASHFSPHSKLGRCVACEGRGYLELPQRVGPPARLECESCLGAKLSSRSLLPRYRGKNFAQIHNLSIETALSELSHVRAIEKAMRVASEFGLEYLKLGQTLDTLSGGELQRLTLSLELKRTVLEGHWFLLFHPGTGLHSPDIAVLGKLIERMVMGGATFVMVENREEFLPLATNIIEFDHT